MQTIYGAGCIVEFVDFNHFEPAINMARIGYWLSEDAQGKGIMTKAVKTLIDFGFNEWKLHKIEIRCATENTPSQKIPERLGFTREGVIRDAQWLYDHYENLILYGLLENE